MVESAPGGRPAFFCGGVSALDCGLLPSWACLGCCGTAGIVNSSEQGCRACQCLLYYIKYFCSIKYFEGPRCIVLRRGKTPMGLGAPVRGLVSTAPGGNAGCRSLGG